MIRIILILVLILGISYSAEAQTETWDTSAKYVLAALDDIKLQIREVDSQNMKAHDKITLMMEKMDISAMRVQQRLVISQIDRLEIKVQQLTDIVHAQKLISAVDMNELKTQSAKYGALTGATGPAGMGILWLVFRKKNGLKIECDE